MNLDNGKYDHLINNIENNSIKDSIFNYKSGQKAFLSLRQGNISEWLERLLPNTRLVIEPEINGFSIGIQYINGNLNKAINKNSEDITEEVKKIDNIPKRIAIKRRIEIRGIVYKKENISYKHIETETSNIRTRSTERISNNFCAFQIFHCRINHYKMLQELKKLNFEIPENQYTNFISDFEIYRECWKEGKLFKNYPTRGIILKINSKKLQKHLGENNLSVNWAYAIN